MSSLSTSESLPTVLPAPADGNSTRGETGRAATTGGGRATAAAAGAAAVHVLGGDARFDARKIDWLGLK